MAYRRVAGITASALLLSGCGANYIENEPLAEIVDDPQCDVPYLVRHYDARTPESLTPRSPARPGVIPDDFEPVAAILCSSSLDPVLRSDMTAIFTEQRREGDLSEAVAMLNKPSRVPLAEDSFGCQGESGTSYPDFWLVDRQGRALRPSLPRDLCDNVELGALRALRDLELVKETEHVIQFDPAAGAEWLDCELDPILPVPGSGTPPPEMLQARLSICFYDLALQVPRFDGAISASTPAAQLFDAPATTCDLPATRVALIGLGDRYTTFYQGMIELDGCQRTLIDGIVPLETPPDVLAAATGSGN